MLLAVSVQAAADSSVVGDVRVQFLSPTLVRLELRGPKGFEDRKTFTVVKRPRALKDFEHRKAGSRTTLVRGSLEVEVPNPRSLKGVTVKRQGKPLYVCDGEIPKTEFFPSPSSMPPSIAIPDNPRIIPAKWGATAAPKNSRLHKDTSGWDLSNQSLDIYVFLSSSYQQFRKEFLFLTGPTELPPLYAFGLWHSRYHPYSEQDALDVIDRYRKEDIPLDGFVVDTDWRVGASHGYATNTKLFPDMKRFIDAAHARNVRLMYNDHPEPVSEVALDPKEMNYREEGLASLLNMGVDVWWYDRNWHTTLREPAPGLKKEVWGASVFHDITQKVKPGLRPMIMSNVPGIDNGRRNYAPHPAAHRFPLWWTGDTTGNFDFLRSGVANAVDGGVESLLPYMSEDLGGHFGNPTPEVYTRFVQYGALSPMMRLHCTAGETRDPWAFGEEAESIVRKYAKLRYRLLPTIYAAARRNYEDGTPIVRRCDLEWPDEKEARRNDQYLLGDDLLVAPILTSKDPGAVVIPSALLRTEDGATGLRGEYFANRRLEGAPAVIRIDKEIQFDWRGEVAAPGLPKDNFSIRWSGKIGPVPATGDYTFQTMTDDGVRLFIDRKSVIDRFVDMDHGFSTGIARLEAGKIYDIRMEYFDSGGQAAARLSWVLPHVPKSSVTRQVWIPPGQWMDMWTGEETVGPKLIEVDALIDKAPFWQRSGGIVLLGPMMEYSWKRPWNEVSIFAVLPKSGKTSRILYEDDGVSNGYQQKQYAKTTVSLTRRANTVLIKISPAAGSFDAMVRERTWLVSLVTNEEFATADIFVNGKKERSQKLEDRTTSRADSETFNGLSGLNKSGRYLSFNVSNRPTSQPCDIRVELR